MTEILILLMGGIIVAVLTPTSLVTTPGRWWKATAGATVIALIVNGICLAGKEHTSLIRDLVAWILVAGCTPLLVGAISWIVANSTKRIWPRPIAACVALAGLYLALPWVFLIVHCTSGDCL